MDIKETTTKRARRPSATMGYARGSLEAAGQSIRPANAGLHWIGRKLTVCLLGTIDLLTGRIGITMAGGYGRDIGDTVAIHVQTVGIFRGG